MILNNNYTIFYNLKYLLYYFTLLKIVCLSCFNYKQHKWNKIWINKVKRLAVNETLLQTAGGRQSEGYTSILNVHLLNRIWKRTVGQSAHSFSRWWPHTPDRMPRRDYHNCRNLLIISLSYSNPSISPQKLKSYVGANL